MDLITKLSIKIKNSDNNTELNEYIEALEGVKI